MGAGSRRLLALTLLGALPILVAVAMFASASSSGSLSADFHNELYPEAELLLDGENPFPGPDHPLEEGKNLIWPPLAAFVISPLTVLPPGAADWTIALLELVAALLSLRLVGVRDWRVYGAFALWPSTIGEIRVSHLTGFLCLLVALAWRYRDAPGAPGVAIGFAAAIKFFLWPLGVWLAAIGRVRETLLAAAVAAASLLLVLPFTGLDDYVRTLLELGRTFDQDSLSVFGFLVQAGAPETAGSRRDSRDRRRAPRRLLASAGASGSRSRQLSSCRRSCGSTTTRSRQSRSPPSCRGSPGSGWRPSPRGACSARGSAPATPGGAPACSSCSGSSSR